MSSFAIDLDRATFNGPNIVFTARVNSRYCVVVIDIDKLLGPNATVNDYNLPASEMLSQNLFAFVDSIDRHLTHADHSRRVLTII